MKYTIPIIWFGQCAIWLFNAINAGIKHNWMAMAAFIWIIVLCATIGFETILRNKMSEELRKLSEKNNESRQSNSTQEGTSETISRSQGD